MLRPLGRGVFDRVLCEWAQAADQAQKATASARDVVETSTAEAKGKQVQEQTAAPERYRSLTFSGGVDEYFTSNAYLSHDNPQGDFLTVLRVRGVWMPRLVGNLFGEITVSEQLYRYARFSSLSINSLDVGGGLVYIIPQLWGVSVFGRYNYNLITNASADAQTYHDQTLAFGLRHTIPIGSKQQSRFFIGINAEMVLEGWPSYALSESFGGYLGNEISLTRSLKLTAFYQLLYQPFLQNQRADWNHFVSSSLVWRPMPFFSVSAMVSGTFNISNESFYTYNALMVGASLSAQLQF